MALVSCLLGPQVSAAQRIDRPRFPPTTLFNNRSRGCMFSLKSKNSEAFGHQEVLKQMNLCIGWSFLGGSITNYNPNLGRNFGSRKSSGVHASWLPNPQIASSAFTLGTAAVLPFYTFMVVAPRAEFTKKVVASSIPYVTLGILYAYLLCLSWTPDTIQLMFASKYWLPELPGIAKMFSSEMTLASAWIHLLAVDLFAARHVYFDGLLNNTETRHSISLCLLFCPIGILSHFITKAATRNRDEADQGIPRQRYPLCPICSFRSFPFRMGLQQSIAFVLDSIWAVEAVAFY